MGQGQGRRPGIARAQGRGLWRIGSVRGPLSAGRRRALLKQKNDEARFSQPIVSKAALTASSYRAASMYARQGLTNDICARLHAERMLRTGWSGAGELFTDARGLLLTSLGGIMDGMDDESCSDAGCGSGSLQINRLWSPGIVPALSARSPPHGILAPSTAHQCRHAYCKAGDLHGNGAMVKRGKNAGILISLNRDNIPKQHPLAFNKRHWSDKHIHNVGWRSRRIFFARHCAHQLVHGRKWPPAERNRLRARVRCVLPGSFIGPRA
jgi:hypothetical protein